MKVKLWGCRGSFPTRPTHADMKFLQSHNYAPEFDFGGETTCVEVREGDDRLLIDAGSGITQVPHRNEYHIMISHLHWDHIHGLNFFVPIFKPGTSIHFYGVHEEIEASVRNLFNGLNFPVPFEALQSSISFHTLKLHTPITVNGFKVTPFLLDHPGRAFGYRIERNKRCMATIFDTEFTRSSDEDMGDDAPFYKGLHAILFDAQYRLNELVRDKMNWGHGSSNFAIDLAIRERVEQVILVHHDPASSYEELYKRKLESMAYFNQQRNGIEGDIPAVKLHYGTDLLELEV